MAGIDVGGGHGGKRSLNQEIPLIPFIDFLLCLVAFLLVTAVWTQMSRINANANVPGPPNPEKIEETPPKDKFLHVEMRGKSKFQLVWKEGTTVINTIDVDRKPVPMGKDGDVTYPDLGKKVESEWKATGMHKNAADKKFDQAILHADNSTPFGDIVAVIDAINTPQREFRSGEGTTVKLPAFNVTFAAD
jgi:biopolymer transport protein ExbD